MARAEGKRWDSRELRLKTESCSQRWETEDAGYEKSSENGQASKDKGLGHPDLDLKHSPLSTDGESHLSGPTQSCHMLLMVPGAEASMRAIPLDGAPCSWSPNLLQPLMASEKCKSCSRSSSRKVPCYSRFLSIQNKRTPSWVTGYITRPRGNLDSTWCQRGVLVTQESGKETGTTELKEPKAMVHTNVVDQSCIVFCNCTFKT